MKEDKQKICDLLLKTLQATRNCQDLVSLKYDTETEIVTAVFENGHKKNINTYMDSGFAVISDVIRNLTV